jgi:hypothetical protein
MYTAIQPPILFPSIIWNGSWAAGHGSKNLATFTYACLPNLGGLNYFVEFSVSSRNRVLMPFAVVTGLMPCQLYTSYFGLLGKLCHMSMQVVMLACVLVARLPVLVDVRS